MSAVPTNPPQQNVLRKYGAAAITALTLVSKEDAVCKFEGTPVLTISVKDLSQTIPQQILDANRFIVDVTGPDKKEIGVVVQSLNQGAKPFVVATVPTDNKTATFSLQDMNSEGVEQSAQQSIAKPSHDLDVFTKSTIVRLDFAPTQQTDSHGIVFGDIAELAPEQELVYTTFDTTESAKNTTKVFKAGKVFGTTPDGNWLVLFLDDGTLLENNQPTITTEYGAPVLNAKGELIGLTEAVAIAGTYKIQEFYSLHIIDEISDNPTIRQFRIASVDPLEKEQQHELCNLE